MLFDPLIYLTFKYYLGKSLSKKKRKKKEKEKDSIGQIMLRRKEKTVIIMIIIFKGYEPMRGSPNWVTIYIVTPIY